MAGPASGVVASGSTGAAAPPGTAPPGTAAEFESVISVVATAAMAPEAGAYTGSTVSSTYTLFVGQEVFRGCSGSVQGGVGGDVQAFRGCVECQKRLRLSREVNECKSLGGGDAAGVRGVGR